MTHDEAKSREIAEMYVRGKLIPPERLAFEDHFFSCAECFQEVEALDRMRSAVKDAVRSEQFPQEVPRKSNWVMPLAIAASVLLAVLSGYAFLVSEPRLQSEREQYKQQTLVAQVRVSELERELAGRQPGPEALPLLVLESARASGGNTIRVDKGASQIALWVEPPPNQKGPFTVEIRRASGDLVVALKELVRNSQGGLIVAIPISRQRRGDYRARLLSGNTVVSEYSYTVTI
ncbi:MAG: hypothetical protein HY820_17400 [Acidobacteria bacterium]|nr:hypothetical protein [Acidobacteriota bacterium]